jgi:hypothetical protein
VNIKLEMELSPSRIQRLPADAIRKIALSLPLEDINHWCRTSKKFNDAICKSGVFWQSKLKQDYPRTSLKDLTPEKMRYKYQLMYANELANYDFENERNKDPRMGEIRAEVERLEAEIAKMHERISHLEEHEMRDIYEEYEDKGVEIRKRANKLKLEAIQYLPEGKGNFINVATDKETYNSILELHGSADASLINDLKKMGVLPTDYVPKIGDLIGISADEMRSLPTLLLYIYKRRGKPVPARKGKEPSKITIPLSVGWAVNKKDAKYYAVPDALRVIEKDRNLIAQKYGLPLPPEDEDEEEEEEEEEEGM